MDSAPLSLSQRRMWFVHQLAPESHAYHLAGAWQLAGALDSRALQWAIGEVVRRHESLRTTFSESDGVPCQIVGTGDSVERAAIRTADWSSLDSSRREQCWQALYKSRVHARLALDAAPLVIWDLVRFGPDLHRLLVTMPHLVADAWSLRLVMGEVAQLYDAHRVQRRYPLQAPAMQYRDYVARQRAQFASPDHRGSAAYWKARLADVAPLELATDRARPAIQTYCGRRELLRLPPAVAAGFMTWARREGLTPFMALLAPLAVMLSRHAGGQTDVAIGTPVSGRHEPGFETVVGCFVNTLVLRVDLSGDPSIATLLQRVREAALQAFAHQDVPFDRVVDEVAPARDLGRNPLTQVLFALQNAPRPPATTDGLTVSTLPLDPERVQVDLNIDVWELRGTIVGHLEYNSDLWEPDSAKRMVEHWLNLLHAMMTAPPHVSIGTLDMLSASERAALVAWNSTTDEAVAPVIERVEACCRSIPDAVALQEGSTCVTFGALNARANRLARLLRQHGVNAETPIGLRLPRTSEAIVAVLAVMKAGGAYVPLDPGYPRARLTDVAADAGVQIAIALGDAVAPEENWRTLALRTATVEDSLREQSPDDLRIPIPPLQLAYLLYTSGSSGRPKGVMVTHAGLSNVVAHMEATLAGTATGRVIWHTTLMFDIAALELFVPLVSGRTCVIAEGGEHATDHIGDVLTAAGHHAVAQATPSAWSIACASGWRPSADQVVWCGGETLTGPLAVMLQESGSTVWNLYGPTETTIWSVAAPLASDADATAAVPIGRPIANTQVHVVDRALQPVPVGVVGELCIGGRGVARGYRHRPGLTAERFVPDPFADDGGRLYCTGDRARYEADGTLVFLGRSDRQVKVRGHRIELDEIENVLRETLGAGDAAVAAHRGDAGEVRLVAYVIPPPGERLWDVSRIRERLSERLPAHMLPAVYVELDAFPLTANGKLDRRRLPPPANDRPALACGYVAPAEGIETELARIWSTVLGVAKVGADDNFFDLGGDSMSSLRIVAHALNAGLAVTVRDLFRQQTIRALASAIADTRPIGGGPPAVDLAPSERDEYPLSPMQRGMLADSVADSRLYVQQIVITLRGAVDAAALRAAWSQVVQRHLALRSRFDWARVDGPRQIVERHASDAWHDFDWRASGVEAFSRGMLADRDQGFALDRAPLWRIALHRIGDDEYRLALTYHHMVMDGWSVPIVLDDLASAYQAVRAGTASQWRPAVPLDAYFEWLGRQSVADAEAYWRTALEDISAGCVSPSPSAGPTSGLYGRQTQRVPSVAFDDVGRRARAARLTVSTVVAGAWLLAVSAWTREPDVTVGVTFSGRPPELAGADRMVGMFINTLPLRMAIDRSARFEDWLLRVQERLSEIRAYEHVPLAAIRRWSGRSPGEDLFDTVVVVENYPRPGRPDTDALGVEIADLAWAEADGQALTLVAVPRGDLTLSAVYDEERLAGHEVHVLLSSVTDTIAAFSRLGGRRVGEIVHDIEEARRASWRAQSATRRQGMERRQAGV